VEEITAAGFEAHVAEPADTQAASGPKRRAKTDRGDCKLLRDLLVAGRLPESWIPPTQVLEWRERVRLYQSLVDQRTQWVQRIHAEPFQHGVTVPECAIRYPKTRSGLDNEALELSPAARQRISVAYRMIDALDIEAKPLQRQLQRLGERQPACRALADAQYGIGGLLAVADPAPRFPVVRAGRCGSLSSWDRNASARRPHRRHLLRALPACMSRPRA
jgi:hypothetical protein